MVQKRVKSGREMEKSVLVDGWISSPQKPVLRWRVEGRNNIEKIINSNYDPEKFAILENVSLNKYDIYHPVTKKQREVKSYFIYDLNNWILYSEPYFKISTRSQLNKISVERYNEFLLNFYNYTSQNGFLKFIQEQMTKSNEGIVLKDGFVGNCLIDFRTIINKNQWKGYDRIQIQFKLK